MRAAHSASLAGEPTVRTLELALLMKSALLAALIASSAAGCFSNTASGRDASSAPGRQPLSVLFVGNSLTYVNDVPALTKSLAASSAIHAHITVSSVTAGGATLSEHWRNGHAVRALRARRPAALIIQAQSTEPLTAPADFFRFARLLKSEADAVGTRTILFQTWARPPRDSFYSSPRSGGSPDAMQQLLNQAYDSLARDLHVEVARVGEAFSLVQRFHPHIALLDGTQHATMAGSYLASAVLFQSLLGRSPLGATFLGGLPPAVAYSLQSAAASVATVAAAGSEPACSRLRFARL